MRISLTETGSRRRVTGSSRSLTGTQSIRPRTGGFSICESAWAHAQQTSDYSGVKIFGFLADPKTNVPIVQQSGDPLPGQGLCFDDELIAFGITADSAAAPGRRSEGPLFLVLPAKFSAHYGIKLGDVAVLHSKSTGKTAFRQSFADMGPSAGGGFCCDTRCVGRAIQLSKLGALSELEAGMERQRQIAHGGLSRRACQSKCRPGRVDSANQYDGGRGIQPMGRP